MFIILLSAFFKFRCFFLAHCHTASRDLSFPTRNPTSAPLQWKHSVLITGLLNSHSVFFFPPTGIQLLYNVVLFSAVEYCESAIYIQIPLPREAPSYHPLYYLLFKFY